MRIIEIATLDNNSHRNQTGVFKNIPKGWAVIPGDMKTPNFPFGEIEVEEIAGVMLVTKWVAGTIPEPELEIEFRPTTDEIMNALLGVTE